MIFRLFLLTLLPHLSYFILESPNWSETDSYETHVGTCVPSEPLVLLALSFLSAKQT
jgi:hypothetical protein